MLDLLNLEIASREEARKDLVRAVKAAAEPAPLYLYLITKDANLYPIRALAAANAGAGQWPQQVEPMLDEALRKVNALRPFTMSKQSFRTDVTFNALQKPGASLAEIPGRKSVIWMSQGVVRDRYAAKICTQLDRENIAFYTVDQTTGTNISPVTQDSLRNASDLTAGRRYEGGHLQEAVEQAGKDARAAYTLGYAPAANKVADKFHKVRVACRRPGVRVRAETGYWGFGRL